VGRYPLRNLIYVASASLLALQWLILRASHLANGNPLLEAGAAGAAIFGAAFLLSWAAEAAETDIPRALAVAFLALIAVLPEYAVDMYFAWQAPHREGYTAFATANMTGGNRLLLGVGWADAAQGDYKGALVPWTELHGRNLLDSAVQEAYLAVPYAFGKLRAMASSWPAVMKPLW